MGANNTIFDATNVPVPVTTLYNDGNTRATLNGLPLGVVSDDPAGEVGLKVIVIAGGGGGGGGGAVTIANGADAAFGATTGVPLAGTTTLEDGTARTGISLFKRIVNMLIAVLAKLPAFGTAGTSSADVLTVQGRASGTPLNTVLTAGTVTIGRVQIRNNADGANIDPLAEATYTGRVLAPATTVNVPAIVTVTGDVFAASATRKAVVITNLGTNPLYIRLATAASATVFHFPLKGCTAQDDGTGGSISFSGLDHAGVVSAFGTSPRFTALQTT